jgi:glycosyltransferase involved in cell wall biosynthesis
MKPIVALDVRSLITGIGRYSEEFLSGLKPSLPGVELWGITSTKNLARVSPHVDKTIRCDAGMYSLKAHWQVAMAAKGASLLHCQHYTVPALFKGPLSVTIHDITHLIDPAFSGSLKSRLGARPMIRYATRRARKIVTVSEYSKRMLVKHLECDPDKVVVIHCGVSPIFRQIDKETARNRVQESLSIPREYFLYVGALKQHKNISTLLRAYALLQERRGRTEIPKLVIVGNGEHATYLKGISDSLGLDKDVIWRHSVKDADLPYVYAAAMGLVLPSRQEGFGLPIIEAMSCGTPVVCAKAGAMPEVAGDSALLFDANSVDECASHLNDLVCPSELSKSLIAKGLLRAQQFVGKAGPEHARFFRELLDVDCLCHA